MQMSKNVNNDVSMNPPIVYADDHQIYHTGADQAAVTLQLKDSETIYLSNTGLPHH